MYASVLGPEEEVRFPIAAGRHAWVHCVSGAIAANGLEMTEGDGLAVSDEASLVLRGGGAGGGELLLFDLG